MPLFDWRCKKCLKETAIIRTTAEYENPPTESETPAGEGDSCVHDWDRFIKAAPSVAKSWNWSAHGSKGNW